MREIRKDPIHSRWVIIASGRAKRPNAFFHDSVDNKNIETCPFCEGREKKTPPEIDSFRIKGKPDESGWKVRVVPNKFPAVTSKLSAGPVSGGFFKTLPSYGAHEVIVETPDHNKRLSNMKTEEISLILKMYKKRYSILKDDKKIRYILIFKNHGKLAGASLPHPHTQIIGLPLIPPDVQEEIYSINKKKNCPYCKIINHAKKDERILIENKDFTVISPYAPTTPYELMILPVEHKSNFEDTSETEILSLSGIISKVFKKYNNHLGDFPFNYFIHTSPVGINITKYHWHILIQPRISISAGFEKGSGIYINSISPESAVKDLKNEKK